jgi:catalase
MQQLIQTHGAPVVDNTNTQTAGPRGPALLEKLAHLDREVIPERRMQAKASGAFGHFTVTHDVSRFTKAKPFGAIGKQGEAFVRFSTVAGERCAARRRAGITAPRTTTTRSPARCSA